jgi:predicted ATP-grasp superfamily ATP-dependent carboligase
MKNILIIDGGGAYSFNMARSLSYCKDYRLHLLLDSQAHIAHRLNHVQYHVADQLDSESQWLKAILRLVQTQGIELLLAGDELATRFLIMYQSQLVPHVTVPALPDLAAFDLARNKSSLSRFMAMHRISQPATFIYDPAEGNLDSGGLSALHFPVLFKLSSGVGGEGIRKFSDQSSLTDYLQSNPPDEAILCQEFIEGRDICISVLCRDGEITAYTIQQCLIDNPKAYAPSLAVEFVHNDNVYREAARLMKLLNWQGVAHIDMRLHEASGEVYIIEVNPRFWESLMASVAAGINFSWLYCQQMLKLPLEFRRFKPVQYVRIRTLVQCLLGQHTLRSRCRLLALRTGLTFHFYSLRRWLGLKS